MRTSFHGLNDFTVFGSCLPFSPTCLLFLSAFVHSDLAFFLFDRVTLPSVLERGSVISSYNKVHCSISDRFIYKLWNSKIKKEKAFYRWWFMISKLITELLGKGPGILFFDQLLSWLPYQMFWCLAKDHEIIFKKHSFLFFLNGDLLGHLSAKRMWFLRQYCYLGDSKQSIMNKTKLQLTFICHLL